MCLGARRDSGSKKRHLHSIPLTVYFFIVRPRTGGHINSVMDETSSSITWKVTHTYIFPKPLATCHGRWRHLPSQSPSLLVPLEGSNHNLLWFLLQIRRSKVKFCISATTSQPSTGMMKQPRWQECGIGRERGPGCRLRALKRRGGLDLAVSWGLVAIRTRYHS